LKKSKSADRDASWEDELRELKPFTRFWRLHIRVLLSVVFGVAVTLLLLALPWQTPTRILVGWDAGALLYLVLIYWTMSRATISSIRQRAAVEDEGALALLTLTTAAAVASLAAVLVELGHKPGAFQLVLGVGTILMSWAFMHSIFALHYTHEFYDEGRDQKTGGLIFPGDEMPDYWDFLYYSLVVAMTAQVSDVQISSKTIRRLTMLHGVVSFFFNVAVLALTINIVSSLM